MSYNLKIAVHNFSPVVIKKKNGWSGFEVELFQEIVRRFKKLHDIDVEYEFEEIEDFKELLNSTKQGKFDMAIAGLTRTKDRFKDFEMSFFTLPSGLAIMTKIKPGISFEKLKEVFLDKFFIKILLVMLSMAIVYAHIFWFLEKGQSVSESYLKGVFESVWWVIVTFSTVGYGDIYPNSILGKIFGLFVIMSGLAVFGVYIAHVSSVFSLGFVKSRIENLDDLHDKKVGTKAGTFSETYLKSAGINNIVVFDGIEDAYKALESNEIDAIVFDQPVLKHDLAMLPKDFYLLPRMFAMQPYAYFFPRTVDGEFLRLMNEIIISIREDGTYDELYAKYFD